MIQMSLFVRLWLSDSDVSRWRPNESRHGELRLSVTLPRDAAWVPNMQSYRSVGGNPGSVREGCRLSGHWQRERTIRVLSGNLRCVWGEELRTSEHGGQRRPARRHEESGDRKTARTEGKVFHMIFPSWLSLSGTTLCPKGWIIIHFFYKLYELSWKLFPCLHHLLLLLLLSKTKPYFNYINI